MTYSKIHRQFAIFLNNTEECYLIVKEPKVFLSPIRNLNDLTP
jgi:hypothetical protein